MWFRLMCCCWPAKKGKLIIIIFSMLSRDDGFASIDSPSAPQTALLVPRYAIRAFIIIISTEPISFAGGWLGARVMLVLYVCMFMRELY